MEPKQIGLGTGIVGLILILLSKIVEITSGDKIFLIAYAASAVIAISFTYIRYEVIDVERFEEKIRLTNLFGEIDLEPRRFLDWMMYAMWVGLVATVVINSVDFILGMLIYLVMQICLIVAFSGIYTLNTKKYLDEGTPIMKRYVWISIVFWTGTVVLVYYFFVYTGPDALIVIPYVIFLGLMAHFSWYGLGYTGRSDLFRGMISVASVIFVFSDALIGNMVYGGQTGPDWIYLLIDVTYVLNIFLMSHAVLFFDVK